MIQLLVEFLDGARTNAVRRNHLLQSSFAHADQSELSGHEERVCCDEQYDCYDSQHNEGSHRKNLTSSSEFPVSVSQLGACAFAPQATVQVASGNPHPLVPVPHISCELRANGDYFLNCHTRHRNSPLETRNWNLKTVFCLSSTLDY